MNPSALIADTLRLLDMPEKLALPAASEPGGICAVFAPHPDDECIMGALPLRLKREAGMRVIVIPVTLGSAPERKAARRTELAASCKLLDFEIIEPAAQCFDQVTPDTRTGQQILWDGMAAKIAALLAKLKPDVIVAPHRTDIHPAHVGAHHLVMDALGKMPEDFTVLLAFSEYYQPQQQPNLLVESPASDVARLIEGLMQHTGEIARNPYHRRLPAWMIDNARRGEELLGGLGAPAGKIAFAALYQIGAWRDGAYAPDAEDRILPADQAAALLPAKDGGRY